MAERPSLEGWNTAAEHSWWAGGCDEKDWESLGPGLPQRPVSSAWVDPLAGVGGHVGLAEAVMGGSILTVRTPIIKLAGLEVSEQRQVSAFQEHTRPPWGYISPTFLSWETPQAKFPLAGGSGQIGRKRGGAGGGGGVS